MRCAARRSRLVLAALAGGALAAAPPARAETLRVFAAASLSDAFSEIARGFEQTHRGTLVELSFAGSQILRTQIEHAAPADVFASADPQPIEALEALGLLEAGRVFARNRLVVVTPQEGARVARLADLARPGIKLVLAEPAAPAGRYALEALAKMSTSGLFESGFQIQVQANVVSRETSVRAVLAKVVLGEADAGIVYRTDAASARGKVRVVPIEDRLNVVAEYAIGVLARSPSKAARAFVLAVVGPEGQAVLRRHGFER